MRRPAIWTIVFFAAALSCAAACNDKKRSAEQVIQEATGGATPEPAPTAGSACETNADCSQGEVCLAQVCAKAGAGAIYADPHNAVTPDKVKAQMEMLNKAAEDRVEKALEEAH